jgi:iron(III) transport system substrate-binding protein
VSGNGMSKNLVAQGLTKAGWTDTDDFIAARDAGAPVAMVPIRDAQGRAILIPNTIALVKGAQPRAQAEAFLRFVLSTEVEILLAKSPARQIPLRGADPAALPAEVREWQREVDNASPLPDLLPTRDAVLAWLRAEP